MATFTSLKELKKLLTPEDRKVLKSGHPECFKHKGESITCNECEHLPVLTNVN